MGTTLNLQIFLVFLWDCGSTLPQPLIPSPALCHDSNPLNQNKNPRSSSPLYLQSVALSINMVWEILLEIPDLLLNLNRIMIFLMSETFKQHLKSKFLQFTTPVFKSGTLPLPGASLNGKNISLIPQILAKQKCVGSKAVFGSPNCHIQCKQICIAAFFPLTYFPFPLIPSFMLVGLRQKEDRIICCNESSKLPFENKLISCWNQEITTLISH